MRAQRAAMGGGVDLAEIRVLDGPNLYFTRPAVKVTLAVPGWMAATEERARLAASRLSVRTSRIGAPASVERRRAVASIAAQVCRRVASEAGSRVAVRGRAGGGEDQIVVAFPWRRLGPATALGEGLPVVLGAALAGASVDGAILRAAEAARDAEPGPRPSLPTPRVPVIAVTGTNGKTTTVRLLVHILRAAGLRVASTTTDGVYFGEEMVQEGDYSGFAGAGLALEQPGVQAAVLETARGGILLRGIGTSHNDVSVVTNISDDHLGMHGIETLDQLAEVKATITKITKRDGWCVLNADDPRVLAMRRGARGRPFVFSTDPDHPAIRAVAAEGGRSITVLDRSITLLARGLRATPLVPVEEVPLTLAGISTPNVQNAMAAAAAALGAGLSRSDVAEALRTFVPDPERNPGRANLFEIAGRTLVVDYAHNEAGMASLVEICRGLRATGAEVWLAFGVAGDRSASIMRGMGELAARGADHVAISELHRYLRGSEPGWVVEQLRAGALDAGSPDVPVFADELTALEWMLARSRAGDVLGLTALGQRREIFAMLSDRGGNRMSPERVRAAVRRAGGA